MPAAAAGSGLALPECPAGCSPQPIGSASADSSQTMAGQVLPGPDERPEQRNMTHKVSRHAQGKAACMDRTSSGSLFDRAPEGVAKLTCRVPGTWLVRRRRWRLLLGSCRLRGSSGRIDAAAREPWTAGAASGVGTPAGQEVQLLGAIMCTGHEVQGAAGGQLCIPAAL